MIEIVKKYKMIKKLWFIFIKKYIKDKNIKNIKNIKKFEIRN